METCVHNKSKFIVLEGPEGSGKTTVAQAVVERLVGEGYKVIYSREPGGIKIAEQIRDVILDERNTEMNSQAEALLYAAARGQHVSEKLKPLLEAGNHIICDRYIYSSLAYQGYARGLGIEAVYTINEFAIQGLMPNKTLFFDLDPKEGLRRIINREKDRLDNEDQDFHERVYEGYKKVFEKYNHSNIINVDANQSLEDVIDNVYSVIKGELDG